MPVGHERFNRGGAYAHQQAPRRGIHRHVLARPRRLRRSGAGGSLSRARRRAPKGFAPIAIGLSLTLIQLISIPVTNTLVNPARSTAPALFAGGWALGQLLLFWLAPIVGAAIAGIVYRWLGRKD
jgi:glycerol uptake facilitator-like aquaporin